MTCSKCKNFQKTDLIGYDLKPYIGKGYTLEEILELSSKDEPMPVFDCPYAKDWCDADDPINWLCDNKFEMK